MVINGVYEKTLYRDEKLGNTVFTVIPAGKRDMLSQFGNIVCRGIIPNYPAKIPLRLNVSKNKDESYGVWNCSVCAYDTGSVTDFLASGYFSGIGSVKAEKYIEKYGIDIFGNELKDDFSGVYEKTRGIMVFEKLFSLIEQFGGTYHHAYSIYKKYGVDCLKLIEENPYILCEIVPFDIIDAFSKEQGIDSFDERRINAVLRETIKKIESRGNTCALLSDFVNAAKRIDDSINPFYIMGSVLSDNSYYYNKDKFLVYDSALYLSEQNTAFNISRLQNNKTSLGIIDDEIISDIEKETDTVYEKQQRDAFRLLQSSGVKIITGGPGTGKTTVINGLIRYIMTVFPEKSIVLAAPTANAAKRMREKTGEDATTIHKLLEIVPFANSEEFAFKNIQEDVVIIDESSFIDTRLASIILQSVKKDAVIIFVGDVDQLPSVGAGKVFRDMIDSGCIETIRLTQIFRQSDGSTIIENAVKIKNGNDRLITDDSFCIRKYEDEEKMFCDAVELMKKYYDKEDPYAVRLYTPVKKRRYKCCTYNFNRELQDYYSDKSDFFVYGYTKFYIGDPVIFTRNNYGSGYCNGDEGRILRILSNEDGKYGVEVVIQDTSIEIKGDDLLDMELSFAITTHKSQGSECDVAIVVVPANPRGMLDRSIIYVASTRARKKTIILTEGDSLSKAIHNDKKEYRVTGLKDMIISKTSMISP